MELEKPKMKVNKAKKNLKREELQALDKEELIELIVKLEAHRTQLSNIIQKRINPSNNSEVSGRKGTSRKFDFNRSFKRHILLKFCYLGWDYQGYVTQEDTIETIEHNIFQALNKVCLIQSRETSNYNRCGRTDKGVSAFEQVISIDVRSKLRPEEQLTQAGIAEEINYCNLLNKVLPKRIRAISWMPKSPTFSARFDCTSRTYKYFFPRGELNIDAMNEACKYFVGSNDFRNFCKMDVGNGVVNYIRRLDNVEIKMAAKNHEGLMPFDMFFLEIKGSAFLWHMIRCIVSILMLVGQECEPAEIVKDLLDVEKNDKKPQYSLASEIPLNLFLCNFKEDQPQDEHDQLLNTEKLNQWIFEEEALGDVITDLQEHWCSESVKSTMLYEMLKVLHQEYSTHFPGKSPIHAQVSSLNRDNKRREYQNLMDRQKCSTLEDRIEHYTKKRRIYKDDQMNSNEIDE